MKKLLMLGITFYTVCAMAETLVPMTEQTHLNVTIYNDNRALVKDERRVSLTQGINEVAFQGVSANMIPQTALLSGTGLTTREQNFNFDLLNQDSLLQKSIGQTVRTEYIDPATGKITNGTATLLAYNHGQPVLKLNNRIETNYPGRILFDKVPQNLRAQPTLVVSVQSEREGTEPVQLDYLTTGMNWNADYVARLNADETEMTLNGFVTLTNQSGTDYNNTTVQLVAGDVNTVRAERFYANRSPKMMMKAASESAAMPAESLSDFYIYTLPHKTTLLANQTKQVALLSGNGIQVHKTYEINNAFPVYADEVKKVKPHIYLSFMNSAENRLGIPLPKGVVRLYKQDQQGNSQFVGEDQIAHTADREEVRLKMGDAFHLKAEMKRTGYRALSDRIKTAGFEITLANGGEAEAKITLQQSFPDGFQLMEQSIEGKRVTSNQIQWTVSVPAKGQAKLTYKIKWGE